MGIMVKAVFRSVAFCAVLLLGTAFFSAPVLAEITGQCSNCHTMHNSQGGASMAFDGSSGPYPALTRGDCLGCHGQNTASNMVTGIPQVYHTAATDLAAGNFRYLVTGGDAKGHNVVEIDGVDTTLTSPPGQPHSLSNLRDAFACSGHYGCHGTRFSDGTLSGSHHQNVDGRCDTADKAYNSYRFIYWTKGYENVGTYKYQNKDANNHNEYYGIVGGSDYGGCDCHNMHGGDPVGASPPDKTISGFCGTCHSDFHMLDEIGGSASGPFIRHPSDIVLPGTGEFAGYTTYDVTAPVGRTTVPSAMSSTVVPGTDVVTCLSCHKAHASEYDDILRWNYQSTTYAAANEGCVVCHTQK